VRRERPVTRVRRAFPPLIVIAQPMMGSVLVRGWIGNGGGVQIPQQGSLTRLQIQQGRCDEGLPRPRGWVSFEGEVFGGERDASEKSSSHRHDGLPGILTDPSYCGQILVASYPLIGNYGVNRNDYQSSASRSGATLSRERCAHPAIEIRRRISGSFCMRPMSWDLRHRYALRDPAHQDLGHDEGGITSGTECLP